MTTTDGHHQGGPADISYCRESTVANRGTLIRKDCRHGRPCWSMFSFWFSERCLIPVVRCRHRYRYATISCIIIPSCSWTRCLSTRNVGCSPIHASSTNSSYRSQKDPGVALASSSHPYCSFVLLYENLRTSFSLAWCELYLILGNVFRKLDIQLHNTRYVCYYVHTAFTTEFASPWSADDFKYKTYFLPRFTGNHMHAWVKGRVD
jgi:hypothetical protein